MYMLRSIYVYEFDMCIETMFNNFIELMNVMLNWIIG